MSGRFKYLLRIWDVLNGNEADANLQRRLGDIFPIAQNQFNKDLHAAWRSSRRLGDTMATPHKRPVSAADYAALSLQEERDNAKVMATGVCHLGDISTSLQRLANYVDLPALPGSSAPDSNDNRNDSEERDDDMDDDGH